MIQHTMHEICNFLGTYGYLRAQNRITEMISSVKEVPHD